MKVETILCGPFVNESERKAFEHLKSRLQSSQGNDEWILLTNVEFSVNNQLQSDEIDMIVIGPTGVTILEIKHWTAKWVEKNSEIVVEEAEKLTRKARKIASRLRKANPSIGFIPGKFFITQEASQTQGLAGKKVRGIPFFRFKDWKEAIDFNGKIMLNRNSARALCEIFEPRSRVILDGQLSRFGGLVDLRLISEKKDRFHRIYRGRYPVRRDGVILHLFDLSAEDKNSETKARREFEALHRLQSFTWAPRLLDSFQYAPEYPGEMCFYTIVDPSAPRLSTRNKDVTWDVSEKGNFAVEAIKSLQQMHDEGEENNPVLHRNISPETILVQHNCSPVFVDFHWAKIPADSSVATGQKITPEMEKFGAPEVRKKGLSSASIKSDIFSLCSSLSTLFQGINDNLSCDILSQLATGTDIHPEKRLTLEKLYNGIASLLGETPPVPPPPPATYWSEDLVIKFHDSHYQIISCIGTGGIGATFKVMKLNKETDEQLGTFIAKAVFNSEDGPKVIQSYNRVQPYLGGHRHLSAIFDVAQEWKENNFTVLMKWIKGAALGEFKGVVPLLAEDLQEGSVENLLIRWLKELCDGLDVLHQNGLIHGDISPRNLILSENVLILTDYDFVTKIGECSSGKGTPFYCSPNIQTGQPVNPSDDFFALAASFFHVLFEREPFLLPDENAKKNGLNWDNISQKEYPILSQFFEKATHPEADKRFNSTKEIEQIFSGKKPLEEKIVLAPRHKEREIEWLQELLQSYPGSPLGNRETRGLDSKFAEKTYVETGLEKVLIDEIKTRKTSLIILCGNAGDGKTALLQYIALKLGFATFTSENRILTHQLEDGLSVKINLDGSASWDEKSADELLSEILSPFQHGKPEDDIVHLLAVNDGRLLEWIDVFESENGESTPLTEQLCQLLNGEHLKKGNYIRYIDLNQRSLVGSINYDSQKVSTEFLDSLVDNLYGGKNCFEIWKDCTSCVSKNRCKVFQAGQVFGPANFPLNVEPQINLRARQRLFEALQAVHQRGEVQITARELRATLIFILFGIQRCSDYLANLEEDSLSYWDQAFDSSAPYRQGDVLAELVFLDPSLEAHPKIDRILQTDNNSLSNNNTLPLESARRKAYFEWSETNIKEIGGSSNALGLANGKNLNLFCRLPFMSQDENKDLCAKLCKGISRLEDLPLIAFERKGFVPLKISPRTPTETAFWVEKSLENFSLEPKLPIIVEGLDILHRHSFLIYEYQDNRKEKLLLGAELFHLLLDLSEGYHLGDASSDDTFAHLSIFIQRLAQEEQGYLISWNPIKEENLYSISMKPENTDTGLIQKLVLSNLERGKENE
ncbi:NERD domain-containing protein [Candidatus Riflebacteria bacterium]